MNEISDWDSCYYCAQDMGDNAVIHGHDRICVDCYNDIVAAA